MRLPTAVVLAALVLAAAPATADEAQQIEFFETHIRPVLIKHCYECHSAQGDSLQGNLALDYRDGLLEGGDSGAVLVPGEPDASLLIEALRYDSFEMPPAGKLPDEVIGNFEKWVEMGAPDPRTEPIARAASQGIDLEQGRQFWAFQPPGHHPAPAVQDLQWPATWVDHFVLAGLEQAGLAPAPDVDPARLLRRLTFDLTGLPPTPQQIAEFVQDDGPEALERAVDRLLGSRQFGEHWGRHWLDVARYADSNGSDFNATFHEAWQYRDYVIGAFNRDKPFDRFVQEQIAGDLLPYQSDRERSEQVIATGFLMLGTKMLSERDKEKLELDVVDEQLDTIGRTFMGMTLGCARCHDHKYDPIPTEDYYALAGILRSTQTLDGEIQRYVSNWVRQPLPLAPEHAEALENHRQQKSELDEQIKQAQQQLQDAEAVAAKAASLGLGVLVDDVDAQVVGSWKASNFSPQYVGQGYLHDDQQDKGEKSVTFVPDLPREGMYEVRLSYASGGNRAANVPIRIQHADGVEELELDQQASPPIANLFKPLGRYRFQAGTGGSVTISNEATQGYVMADAAQFVAVEELEAAEQASEAVQAAQAEVDRAGTVLKALEEQLKKLQADAPPPPPRALAVQEAKQIDDCHVCIRGEPHNRGEQVPRGFLQVAQHSDPPNIPENQSGRRELAQWLASPQHPLTARVMVNRIWRHLIGEGLVRSVDNFGQLGERPTHPELLDRLAVEFVQHDWSVKRLVRQIALSRTYRMDSRHDERAWNADPENRLLWRAHRRRLPAEAIRDSLLAISGRLDLTPGSSPVQGLGTLVSNNRPDDEGYAGGESSRRSLYLPIIRNELPAMLTAFDFADPDFVTGRRPVTTVPSQALLLLNSPLIRQCALDTADRLLAQQTLDADGRVQWIYRTVLGRESDRPERQRAVGFVNKLSGRVADQDNNQDKPEPAMDEREAWGQVIHALFASTEFRMLD